MISMHQNGREVMTDGKTVWVNDSDGMCLGRFTPRGVDIHGTTEQQMSGIQCEDCFPRNPETPDADWERFAESMKSFHGVEIHDNFRPLSEAEFRAEYMCEFPMVIGIDPAKSGSDQVAIRCACGKMRDVNLKGEPHIPCWSCGL